MRETFYSGDVLLVQKYGYNDLNRFSVAAAHVNGITIVKRVIGLPHETVFINDGKVYINGQLLNGDYGDYISDAGLLNAKITLGDNDYFLLGDNRNESVDSRVFGAVNIKDIKGVAVYRIYPFGKAGRI